MAAARNAYFAARRERLRGARAFKKMLGKLPQAIRDEMVASLEQGGRAILAVQRADAPVKRGALRNALSMRVLRGAMSLKVGLVGRPLNRRLFYARIVEHGREAQISRASRSNKSGIFSFYDLRVRGMVGRPFIWSPATLAMRETLGGATASYWDRVLASAAQGVTDA